MIKLLHTSVEALSVAIQDLKKSKERTMTKPTVTKAMVQAAWVAFINPHKLFDMRGAITAALNASGLVERIAELEAKNLGLTRTMQDVRLVAVDAQLRASYHKTALEIISDSLRIALNKEPTP